MFLAGMFTEDDKKLINQYFGSNPWNDQSTPVIPA
jgi:hypothetical protein